MKSVSEVYKTRFTTNIGDSISIANAGIGNEVGITKDPWQPNNIRKLISSSIDELYQISYRSMLLFDFKSFLRTYYDFWHRSCRLLTAYTTRHFVENSIFKIQAPEYSPMVPDSAIQPAGVRPNFMAREITWLNSRDSVRIVHLLRWTTILEIPARSKYRPATLVVSRYDPTKHLAKKGIQ